MNQPISNRIYVAGLDGKVSASDLRTYFSTFGEMTDVYIPNNHQTGQPKHFGFVTFAEESAAQTCMSSRTHEINGQPVELKPCVAKDQMAPKGGGKGDAGAAGLLGMAGGLAPGLGMGMPLQPALGGLQMQQFGGLQPMQQSLIQPGLQPGLQALQQQMLMQQQQQLQQHLLQQLMAKMQQPQQFAQPNPMMQMQFGGCAGLPAAGMPAGFPTDPGSSPALGLGGLAALPAMGLPADQGLAAGLPAEQGSSPAGGFMQFTAPDPNMQALPQPQPFMSFPGAMNFGAPAMEANPGAVAQPVLTAPPALTSSSLPEGMAAFLPPVDQSGGHPALAFAAVSAPDPGQGTARVAPY